MADQAAMISIRPVHLEDYFEIIEPGAIRIKGHRIGIEHVVERYKNGLSPEQIAQDFPGLNLEKIYATITYYLHHKAEIDAYIVDLNVDFEQFMQDLESREVPPVVRRLRNLRARREREQQPA
jgi:uncharacterized protein (DUF433 family)